MVRSDEYSELDIVGGKRTADFSDMACSEADAPPPVLPILPVNGSGPENMKLVHLISQTKAVHGNAPSNGSMAGVLSMPSSVNHSSSTKEQRILQLMNLPQQSVEPRLDNITPVNKTISDQHKSNTLINSSRSRADASVKSGKRKYSRNGCTECKRRRMKCDEGKPVCWQCSRLNRSCVYIINPKNKKRKKPMASGMVSANETVIPPLENIPPRPQDLEDDLTSKRDSSSAVSFPPKSSGKPSIDTVPNLLLNDCINVHDASLLIQNLNDIVNMKLNDSAVQVDKLVDVDLENLVFPEMTPLEPSYDTVPISFLADNFIIFDISLESFSLGEVHERYVKAFYYDCLDSIAPFFQDQSNPLRDILLYFAKSEPYLLSAILASGASITYTKSLQVEDEKAYCGYLSRCLDLLNEQFQNENNIIKKIEPIILTVILLSWDCIHTLNSQWRSHLKGVTELFKKTNLRNSSKVLNVAKCWFKVIETFAGISTALGGSLVEDVDLDVIFDPSDGEYVESLKFLNIMTPLNEFNLLRGHKEDFDVVIKEVFKLLNCIKSSVGHQPIEANVNSSKQLDHLLWSSSSSTKTRQGLSYFKIQKILVEIDKQLEYKFIDNSGIIPIENQSHPNISHILDNAIDLVLLKNGKSIAISWYDISHQTQVLSFLLVVLLKLLGIPKESIAIQQVVRRIMSFFKFLDSDKPPKNLRTCYCNFAVFIAGLNAIDEETRELVRKYYTLNGGQFQKLTEYNLTRMEKVWYGRSEHSEKRHILDDQDVLTW
ncbi:Lys14p Ecym_5131 [Eremothecium cymbalariae DBVPG|uniref:Zn(2)-C6 fungal-type domain-containing protein n=1 Tax=Eremothecium cymbalariae (strain CBS 270.75 / DBVPG 7215 / KCTC 17166 / NRRL Y-17582) TaxID=931890 RepID=I6NCW7_ERECY|nr:hypothetical protein Ecym_5131 [Eremothecium cymbalariae DBVPG\